jgi:hypothetical protein
MAGFGAVQKGEVGGKAQEIANGIAWLLSAGQERPPPQS